MARMLDDFCSEQVNVMPSEWAERLTKNIDKISRAVKACRTLVRPEAKATYREGRAKRTEAYDLSTRPNTVRNYMRRLLQHPGFQDEVSRLITGMARPSCASEA